MKRTLAKFRNSPFNKFIRRHQKYGPVFFFIAGFIFDTLTLGRIDGWYVMIVLCLHMILLTATLFAYNLVDDGKWKNTLIDKYQDYFPLAIQFFFGSLSSAYVIYFSRSVSLSRAASFLVILLILLFANETLKKRISNKYLQFSVYAFISFTFFSFMIPVFIKEMNNTIFFISGAISLAGSLFLITVIYKTSPSTREEIHLGKLTGITFIIYALINTFYFFKLIPPVPLALEKGLVAHNIRLENNKYIIDYEEEESLIFWRDHKFEFIHNPDDNVYVFSSIFAPTELKKSIFHRWKWYNEHREEWELIEDIGYVIEGGRDGGYRGYTFKKNVKPGLWKVQVITEEEMILGVIDFKIITSAGSVPKNLKQQVF
ncbi:DUF2914 domain-containing protein [Fulvivirga lutimaris]|uniref:DUF2914 domain-containing protein n=1 Tax=Fulvivirga lutimaris TaxID=1819566 RepID=UPI0012BCDF25|nr:DUF2914 domain-containing protein [Fulvivirga lutimaris]MTI41201.1 DUF2914 domain-containing protein [Fulvivirga lutimaris]